MISVFTNLVNISSETDKIYPSKSAFIEILNPNKTNVIVGCIHLYPHMDLNEYNGYYINKYSLTNEFLDSLSYMLQPHCTTNKNKK